MNLTDQPKAILLLKQELAQRCSRNPRYSLRAFAKSLGLSHTVLSLALSGKRPISKKAAQKITKALSLSPAQQAQAFPFLIKREIKNSEYQKISLATYSVMASWKSYAIMSLLELPEARFNAKWIAKRLGIPEVEAKIAMENLEQAGMVAEVRPGVWKQNHAPIAVENTVSTDVTRKFHRELLARASESLDTEPMPRRDFSSITFAMDAKLVPHALKRIRSFRRKLCAELESRADPTDAYTLSVQLFPLSTQSKETSQ